MATYTATRSTHQTLTANTVDTVTVGPDYPSVEVKNRATTGAGISFTVDGTTPAVLGNDTYIVLPGESLVVPSPATTGDVVKLISATADAYSVTGVA